MMTTIYFIRHAEAEGNLYRRLHGQHDTLLTPTGVRQAEALRRRFAGVRLRFAAAACVCRSNYFSRGPNSSSNFCSA